MNQSVEWHVIRVLNAAHLVAHKWNTEIVISFRVIKIMIKAKGHDLQTAEVLNTFVYVNVWCIGMSYI